MPVSSVLCFACSLFFTANIGVGPYDALGFMLSRFTKLPYKWVRVLTDVTVVSIGLLVSGGFTAIAHGDFASIQNIGIGTVITAFCMGPLINFFNKTLSAKIFNVDYAQISKDVAFLYDQRRDAEKFSGWRSRQQHPVIQSGLQSD